MKLSVVTFAAVLAMANLATAVALTGGDELVEARQLAAPTAARALGQTKAERKAAQKAAQEKREAAEKARKQAQRAAQEEREAAEKARKQAKKAAQEEREAVEKAKKQAKKATKKEKEAAKKAKKQANKAAKKEAKKKRKAAKNIAKKEKRNKKKGKKAKNPEDTKLIGGKCVADHYCATVRGDPHIETFDGLKYDCQGHGEFVLSSSMDPDSSFEIQGRFVTTNRSDKSVSVTKGISIDTGIEGAPTLVVYTEEVDSTCIINYYVNSELAEFGEDGKAIRGIDFMEDVDGGKDTVDFVYFTESEIMYTVMVKMGSWGCVLNSKICLPPDMVENEEIVGLLGTPNGDQTDDWMDAYGANLVHDYNTGLAQSYPYCTREWCVHNELDSIFGYEPNTEWADFYGCEDAYDSSAAQALANPSEECVSCCAAAIDEAVEDQEEDLEDRRRSLQQWDVDACILECMEGGEDDCKIEIENEEVLYDVEKKCPDTEGTEPPEEKSFTDAPEKTQPPEETQPPTEKPTETTPNRDKVPGSSSGDPHFKTWTGDKYDYHGECDLVLVDNPTFADGLGLRVHIRTTQVKYFSFVEKVAVQIGKDVLEFANDVDNFYINGEPVGNNKKHHKTMLGGAVVRRDTKALSIRLSEGAKVDLHMRMNGFPSVIVDGAATDVFKGSLGLLGDWETGKKLARDGKTELDDATTFALEWQVRGDEPMLFQETRFPQFPQTCTPPKKMPTNRLGMDKVKREAEEACAHWKEDKEDCIFDVIATRDVLVAEEGHIVQVE